MASREGLLPVVRLLLYRGAVPDQQGTYKRTPLHWACENKHAEVALDLLGAEAAIDVADKVFSTAGLLQYIIASHWCACM